MGDLHIRAMTQEEFSPYRRRAISQYAAELVRAGASTEEQAEQQATKETDASLPDGADTGGMVLLVGETAGEVLGVVGVGPAPAGRAGWWIYDIEVVPAQRGRGYGRALLEAAEREAQRRGGGSIGLNVFGGNAVALGMYESSGYEVAAIQMQKALRVFIRAGRAEVDGRARLPDPPGLLLLPKLSSELHGTTCGGSVRSRGS